MLTSGAPSMRSRDFSTPLASTIAIVKALPSASAWARPASIMLRASAAETLCWTVVGSVVIVLPRFGGQDVGRIVSPSAGSCRRSLGPVELGLGDPDGSSVSLGHGALLGIAARVAEHPAGEHDERVGRGAEVAVPPAGVVEHVCERHREVR